MRLKGIRLKTRIAELRRSAEVTPSVGLAGPRASVKLNKTTRQLLGSFCVWIADRGVLIEDYEYEMQGAVARSIDEIRDRLRKLADDLPKGDPEHAAVGELREALRVFANRHNPNMDWDAFSTNLGEQEWKALQEVREKFAGVLLDWYDVKGLDEAQAFLVRIPLQRERWPWLPPAS